MADAEFNVWSVPSETSLCELIASLFLVNSVVLDVDLTNIELISCILYEVLKYLDVLFIYHFL